MTLKLTAYINFNGNAKDALDFYHGIFGGTVEADTFGEFNKQSGGAMPVPTEDQDKIMHATLTGDLIELMISDYPSNWTDSDIATSSNIVLSLSGDDDKTLRMYWEQLEQGGKVTQPLEIAPWGDAFGSIVDQFGVSWMVNISGVN